MKKYLPVILFVAFLSCKQNSRDVTPAIYYWKSSFNPTSFEKRKMDGLNMHILYVKFFDIAWDDNQNMALPVAKIFVRDTAYLRTKQVVPTVFLTNEIFYKLDSAGVKHLAANTASLIKKYLALYRIDGVTELQIDCDWTATTKNLYFYFLNEIKRQHIAPVLSATIRLHQVKYITSSGVPPADRGLLMCYNMGNLQQVEARNSIIDPEEFKKYQSYLRTYQLPLDIGLPLFDWYVLFRNNKYAGLFQSLPQAFLDSCKKSDAHVFEVSKDTVISGRLLKAGDLLRYENSDAGSVKKIAALLNGKLTLEKMRVVLYHCDSVILSKYPTHELEEVYSSLRRY